VYILTYILLLAVHGVFSGVVGSDVPGTTIEQIVAPSPKPWVVKRW